MVEAFWVRREMGEIFSVAGALENLSFDLKVGRGVIAGVILNSSQ